MRGQFRFGVVYIIQSLRRGDTPTGRNLHDELEPICINSKPAVECRLRNVTTAAEFFALLTRIASEATQTGTTPVLQIETHGCPDGIQLSSGEFLDWVQIKPYLQAINEATRLNLFVILAACDGAGLLHVIQPAERAAVLCLIGPKRAMRSDDMETAMLAFYRTLFAARDAVAAWKAMNAAIDPTDRSFSVFTAEFTFKHLWRHYHHSHHTPEALAERVARIEAAAIEQGHALAFVLQRRSQLMEFMNDEQAAFDHIRSQFFFTDLWPENLDRFPMTLEECQGSPD